MELFHTSPNKIEKISDDGRFGEFLCFASAPYSMSACDVTTYSIEIDEENIIAANELFYIENSHIILADLINEVSEMAHVDTDTAMELIDGSESLWNIDVDIDNCDKGEVDWDIQKITAKAAKVLGYRGVSVSDEQGTCWMMDMVDHENELQIVEA